MARWLVDVEFDSFGEDSLKATQEVIASGSTQEKSVMARALSSFIQDNITHITISGLGNSAIILSKEEKEVAIRKLLVPISSARRKSIDSNGFKTFVQENINIYIHSIKRMK